MNSRSWKKPRQTKSDCIGIADYVIVKLDRSVWWKSINLTANNTIRIRVILISRTPYKRCVLNPNKVTKFRVRRYVIYWTTAILRNVAISSERLNAIWKVPFPIAIIIITTTWPGANDYAHVIRIYLTPVNILNEQYNNSVIIVTATTIMASVGENIYTVGSVRNFWFYNYIDAARNNCFQTSVRNPFENGRFHRSKSLPEETTVLIFFFF